MRFLIFKIGNRATLNLKLRTAYYDPILKFYLSPKLIRCEFNNLIIIRRINIEK